MICSIAHQCGGCTDFHAPQIERITRKRKPVLDFLRACNIQIPVPILHVGEEGIRDKVDLQFQSGEWGFFTSHKRVVPTKRCPKSAPLINDFLMQLWDNPMPIQRASVRLRRAPDNTLGIWIDAANLDILALLKEQRWLRWLHKNAIVEIGQRHKRLILKEDSLKLQKKKVLYPWFETTLPSGQRTPLFTTIAGFTQPSIQINRTLVEETVALLQRSDARIWLEYGSGAGNFSFPLSQIAQKVYLSESNPTAKRGLERGFRTLSQYAPFTILSENLNRAEAPIYGDVEGIILDPPRSGANQFMDNIVRWPNVRDIVYVSCSFESLKADLSILLSHHFSLCSIKGIDQFPRSHHCEWVVYLRKSFD
ncbi:MAG: hypothetical protein VX278_15855 [Myxococcota bacterium]|nr:hypothetical protein [Myxococcota bacterium]